MQELPGPVKEAIEKLKKEHKYSISVARINGGFYAYEVKSEMKNGKRSSKSLYLGKISDDGTFVPARHKKKETDAKTLEESMRLKAELKTSDPIESMMHPDETDLKILEAISANGRAGIPEIAEYANTTTAIAKRRLRILETRYNISYIPEFGPRPFGFFRYVVFVRFFKGKVPEAHKIKEVLEKEPRIQFAALLKGKYHLFMYLFAENTKTLDDTLYSIRSDEVFANIRSLWQVSYITYAYGYTPIRQEFFDLLKERVWYRSKEHPKRKPEQILQREYDVLRILNKDGRKGFLEIDNELGLSKGSADYTYYRLLEKLLIERITIRMDKLPARLNAVIRIPQTYIKGFNVHREEFVLHLINNPKTPTNRYALEGDIGIPYGLMYIKPIYDDVLENVDKELRDAMAEKSKPDIEIITDMLVGSIGFRRLPTEETYQYKVMIKEQEENRLRLKK
jgi:DNA-binding Lrp family transcriptional regulator